MHHPSDLGQIVGDRYLILDSIGQGAMADVHLARDQRDGREVAIKWLVRSRREDKAYREKLQQEAELLALVKHPNVIDLYNFGATPDGLPYLVMEALIGESLHEYIARRGAMPMEHALPLIIQLGRALQAVHAAGLVHGDVKPHNIFLCGPLDVPDTIKLIDFGFAQLSATDTPVSGDMVAGTLQYMAPEQLLSDPIDARSDIYSMGIVMYRWITAELPFDSGATLGLFAHHIGSLPPPPSWLIDEMHPGLEKVMLACMRKNPANRYTTVEEVLVELGKVLAGTGDVTGVPICQIPDEYRPLSEQGRRAVTILHRAGLSEPAVG